MGRSIPGKAAYGHRGQVRTRPSHALRERAIMTKLALDFRDGHFATYRE
jgi:hypothetical protein